MDLPILPLIKKNRITKKIIHSNLILAVLMNLFFLLLIIFFCDMKYEVSDDFIMASILSGSFGNAPNPQMIFVNVFIGYMLIPFYTILPQISWYFVFQIAIVCISSISVTYLCFKKLTNFRAVLLSVLLIVFFTTDAYILVQFTKTAMFAVMAGTLLFINTLFSDFNKKEIILGGLLCLIGTMIRFYTVYLAGGFILYILIIEFIRIFRNKKQNWHSHIIKVVVCGSLLISFVLIIKGVDWYTYHNDEAYGFFSDFNFARAQIVDYTDYGYETYAKELSKIDVSENDYAMLKTWNFADNDYFTIEKLQQVAAVIKDHYNNRNLTAEQLLEKLQNREIQKYPSFLACVLLIVLCIFLNYPKCWGILGSTVIGFVLFFYFAYREREIYRIEYSILLGIFLCGVYIWQVKPHDQQALISISQEPLKICTMCIFILLSNLIIYIPDKTYQSITSADRVTYIDNTFKNSWGFNIQKYRKVVNKDKPSNGLLNEIETNKQNFYFLDFNTTIQTLYFEWPPYRALPINYFNNVLYFAGVTSNFPDTIESLEKYNVSNPLKSLVNENVYLVDNETLEIKLNYLKEHYYPNARAELYKETDGYLIWKIYEK